MPGQQKIDSDRQLALYQLGLQQKWSQAKKVRLVWHYVAFDFEFSSTRTPEQLVELRRQVMAIIEKIEADREFPPKERALCNWRGLREFCPLKKHEAILEHLPAAEYLQEEGVVLVNKYIDYLKKRKEAEAELEKLKEAIIQFAQARQLERVRGSEFYLTLKKQERIHFPVTLDKNRVWLEKVIKQAGLWESFSTLDRYALGKAIRSRELEPVLLQELAKWFRKETVITLYLGRKRGSPD